MAPNAQKPYFRYMLMHYSTVVLRFVLLTPTIYYWANAMDHHKLVRGNILFYNGTYSPAIASGERLADKLGSVTLLWDCVIWIPTLMLPPPLNLPIAVGDTILAGYVSRATAYQSEYTPNGKKACRDMSTFHNERPPGTNESFFAAAARLNGTATTPTKMCQSFVEEWQYGVTLSFFYALMSLVGIAAFIACIRIARQQFLKVYETTTWMIFGSWKCTLFLIFHFYSIPAYIFRGCLPMKAKAPVRTARRYAVKTVLRVEQKTELALKELKTEVFNRNNSIRRYKGAQGESTPLAQFLGVYDMLMMVIPYLHYVDAVNLASVSKSVRDSVLPPDDLYRRLILFKTLTCSDFSRHPCWVCSSQTCTGCYKLASVTLTTAIHHLENCHPYCISCYYQNVALKAPPYWARLKNLGCQCAPISVHSSKFYKRFMQIRSGDRTQRAPRREKRPVCRACSTLTSEEMTFRKGESAKLMLKKGQKSDGQKWATCAKEGCGKPLGSGPRFWVCTGARCHRECKSRLHQAWGAENRGAEEVV